MKFLVFVIGYSNIDIETKTNTSDMRKHCHSRVVIE